MMKQFAFILLLLLTACSQENEMPKDVLPVSKMKMVIWDMSLADNMATDKYMLNKDSQRIMATGLYQKVFSLHKINKATFYKSFAYYEAHPTALQTLFDSVNAYGMREKANLYQKKPNIK
jgi:hypothetical protein